VSALEIEIAAAGIPALGYFAQVPHYVSGPYATAALELLRALAVHLDAEIPAHELADEARELRARLDAAAGLDETTRSYVERLEGMYDEQRLPSGDDLISDIERFLRDQGGATRGSGGRAVGHVADETGNRPSARCGRPASVQVSSKDRRRSRFAGSAAARHPAGGSTRRRSRVSVSGVPFAMTARYGPIRVGWTCRVS
jgi:hypothetical protein